MSEVAASYMTNPTGEEILQYLLDAGEAQYPVEVKWGKGYRNVVIFQGKKYLYKLGVESSRILVVCLYESVQPNRPYNNQVLLVIITYFRLF